MGEKVELRQDLCHWPGVKPQDFWTEVLTVHLAIDDEHSHADTEMISQRQKRVENALLDLCALVQPDIREQIARDQAK